MTADSRPPSSSRLVGGDVVDAVRAGRIAGQPPVQRPWPRVPAAGLPASHRDGDRQGQTGGEHRQPAVLLVDGSDVAVSARQPCRSSSPTRKVRLSQPSSSTGRTGSFAHGGNCSRSRQRTSRASTATPARPPPCPDVTRRTTSARRRAPGHDGRSRRGCAARHRAAARRGRPAPSRGSGDRAGRAGVTAAHRDHDVAGTDVVGLQPCGSPTGDVQAELLQACTTVGFRLVGRRAAGACGPVDPVAGVVARAAPPPSDCGRRCGRRRTAPAACGAGRRPPATRSRGRSRPAPR